MQLTPLTSQSCYDKLSSLSGVWGVPLRFVVVSKGTRSTPHAL